MRITGLLLFVLVTSLSAGAAQVTDLYQAEVEATGGAAQWQRLALQQVLVRVTGNADIAGLPAIAPELAAPSAYVKQFESVRHQDGNRMRVLLDAVKINQLLQSNQLPVWGNMRPDILVWLVVQDGQQRRFIRSADTELTTALQKAFKQSALPLLQPLYDFDDVNQLSDTDVWAGFWQPITQASGRYNPDIVIAATVDMQAGEGNAALKLSWQRQADNRTFRDEVTAADADSLMQAFASLLASQLAQQYASVLSSESGAQLLLEVQQLQNLADIVNVQRLLQQLVGVTEVTISRFANGSAYYLISSSTGADGLMNALRFSPRLKLAVSASPTATEFSEPVLGTVETAQPQALDSTAVPVLATFIYSRP